MKKIIVFITLCLVLVSCKNFNVTSSSYDKEKEINIIFTSLDDATTLKEDYNKVTPNVTVVGCGDIVNKKGYDYSAIGKNEFEKGVNSFYDYSKNNGNKFLACNLSYSGKVKDIFKKVDPYVVIDYDGIKIGYIGVTSPNIKNILKEDSFTENDSVVVNFYDEAPEVLYDTIKEAICNVKEQGAKYVVLLCFLGTSSSDSPYSAYDVISNINNVDVVLDGNSNTLIKNEIVKDADNKDVNLCAFNSSFDGCCLIKIEKENISIEFK